MGEINLLIVLGWAFKARIQNPNFEITNQLPKKYSFVEPFFTFNVFQTFIRTPYLVTTSEIFGEFKVSLSLYQAMSSTYIFYYTKVVKSQLFFFLLKGCTYFGARVWRHCSMISVIKCNHNHHRKNTVWARTQDIIISMSKLEPQANYRSPMKSWFSK